MIASRSPVGGRWGKWLGWVIGLAVAMGALAWLGYAVPHWAGTPAGNEPSPSLAPTHHHAVTAVSSPAPSDTPRPSASLTATTAPSPAPLLASKLVASPTATSASPSTPSLAPTSTAPPISSVSRSLSSQPTATLGPSLILTAATPSHSSSLPLTVSPTASATVASPLPLVDIPPCSPPPFSPHLWLARPIPPEANDWVSTYYPYGSTAGGEYLIHHGVDIGNPEGTPVWAAGVGTVLYAGDDRERVFGPQPDFYGQLVILQMDREYHGQPVFTLYGHLSAVSVHEGQRVEEGQKLGEVGATGIALGPHLHFEVRVTDPYGYNATRNPELWLRPHPGRGLIAGQVLDGEGQPLPEVHLILYPAHDLEHPQREGWTYASRGVNRDEELLENLVWGDVQAGEWVVMAHLPDKRLRQRVPVRPGEISWICLHPPDSPTQSLP